MANSPAECPKGRHSDGMHTEDWKGICLAVDTWNEANDEPDTPEFCKVMLEPYGLWDVEYNEPNHSKIRQFYIERC